MKKRPRWGILLMVPLLIFTSQAVVAAPSLQDDEPGSPATVTPTDVVAGPTYTPTTTLQPPPSGGGRVSADTLAVLSFPDSDAGLIGTLRYDDVIFPIGRTASANWIAIDWGRIDNQPGWVAAHFIIWADDVAPDELPVLQSPYLITPAPGSTLFALTATVPVETPVVETPLVEASTTPEPPTPSPTATALILPTDTGEPTLEPTATATEEAAAPVVEEAPPTLTPQPEPTVPAPTPDQGVQIDFSQLGLYIAFTVAALILLFYLWRLLSSRRELRRYMDGFELSGCPVCQSGDLALEEARTSLLGVVQVRRLVRCDNCRSVIREVNSGLWRYNIDPLVNPEMAAEYNGQEFAYSELVAFAKQASLYAPDADMLNEPDADFQSADEIVAEMEARYLTELEEEAAAAEEEVATEDDNQEENSEEE